MSNKERDIFDILTDEENNENVFIFNSNGDEVEFEQVAVIPQNDTLYAILHPVNPSEVGIADDEALVFVMAQDGTDGNYYLVEEENEEIAESIFQIYQTLLDEQE